MIDKNCVVCGEVFTVDLMRKRQRTCKSADCLFKLRSQQSSARMKRRRNGGDPALNAKLAKACGDHFRRMWQKPEFRAKISAASRVRILAYMADESRRRLRDETNKAIMGKAARRLRRDPEFTEIMSAKVKDYMAQEPFRPAQHGDYATAYMSMIMSRVNTDEEVRTFCDGRMSIYLKDELVKWRANRTLP